MNKPLTLSIAAAALALAAGGAVAADVGVSISVNQPGVYGRIDIGQFPQPAVIMAQPMIMQPAPVYMGQPPQPLYLRVPPGHRKHWGRHCAEYNACGAPVYFVREDWYQRNVMRAPQHGGEMRRDDRRDVRRDERRDDRRDERGNGHGHGKGNGHGRQD